MALPLHSENGFGSKKRLISIVVNSLKAGLE